MAIFQGTVSSIYDFADVIREKAEFQGYTVLENDSSNGVKLALENISGDFLGFLYDATNDDNLFLNAGISYDPSSNFYENPGSLGEHIALNKTYNGFPAAFIKDNTDIYVYLNISDDTIKCVYCIENVWLSFVLGRFTPYADSIDYPNPIFVGGNCPIYEPKSNLHSFQHNQLFLTKTTQDEYYNGALNQNNNWLLVNDDTVGEIDKQLAIEPFYNSDNFSDLVSETDGSTTLIPINLYDFSNGYILGNFGTDIMACPNKTNILSGQIYEYNTSDYIIISTSFAGDETKGKIAIKIG